MIFEPGTPDPYMLFDHKVKEEWREKIPAVVHLDNTARLQTVNRQQNETVYRILAEFRRITGVPLLCNTSANLNGSGFFPDLRSAQQWGKIPHIWSDNVLYIKK
jgi:carbamoyltransferase